LGRIIDSLQGNMSSQHTRTMDLDRRKRRRMALRRRRRREDRLPISASLLLDEKMREDVGIVSEDLWADLFPSGWYPFTLLIAKTNVPCQ
jgi:hypothetical protein